MVKRYPRKYHLVFRVPADDSPITALLASEPKTDQQKDLFMIAVWEKAYQLRMQRSKSTQMPDEPERLWARSEGPAPSKVQL